MKLCATKSLPCYFPSDIQYIQPTTSTCFLCFNLNVHLASINVYKSAQFLVQGMQYMNGNKKCKIFLTRTKTNDCIKHQQFENVIQRDSLSNDRLYRSNSFNKLTSMSKKY